MRRLLGTLTLCALAACTTAEAAPPRARPARESALIALERGSPRAGAEVQRVGALLDAIHAREAADLEAAVALLLEQAAEFVRSIPPPRAAPRVSPSPAPATSGGPIATDFARWERLHNCEQPGNWYANGGNPADPAHQTFQGGLGMSTQAWQMAVRAAAARGVSLPGSALSASPEQQMVGAQAFYDAYGWGWACRT